MCLGVQRRLTQCDPQREARRRHRAVRDALQRAARFRQARPLPSRVGPARGLGLPLPPDRRPGDVRGGAGGSRSREPFESRRGRVDPLDGLAEAFSGEIQPLLEAPWAVAMGDLVYPQTRGERPPDFETRIQYARALMRLAAEDYETYKIVFEVRSLLKPQSALREPELASRVMSMMAVA